MNIHPIVVHFPIALLTVYCLLEFIRFKKIMQLSYWFYLKALCVIIGSFASVFAFATGNLIEHQFEDQSALVEVHSFWANLTVLIFGLIAFSYFIAFIERGKLFGAREKGFILKMWNIALLVKKIVIESFLIFPLVLFGLLAVTITGALGGIIVYGANLDPFTRLVYNLFVNK